MKSFADLSYRKQRTVVSILFLFVPLCLILVFGYLPLLTMLEYSFLKWDGLGEKVFIGLENYRTIFSRYEDFKVFGVSLYYFAGSFVQLGLALYFATVLSFELRFKNFFKGLLFFPNLINGVAIGFIFLYFFRDTGTLNSFLQIVGLEKRRNLWLTNPNLINVSLTAVSIWRYLGFNMVLFLGAIQSISREIFEAAELDGADRVRQFRYIIFPSIKSIVKLNLILAVKGALSVFEIPYIMTGGGNGSTTFVIKTIDTAFKFNKIGLASAMAVVLTIIILLVTAVQERAFTDKGTRHAA